MSREEVQKLLGGYATGTLTAEEQQALFEAALEDQELFDTLAREQGLRDLLRDPAAKAELLAALDEPRGRAWWGWMRRPWVAGLAMAGLAAIGVTVWQTSRRVAPVPQSNVVAEVRPQPAAPQMDQAQPPPIMSRREAERQSAATVARSDGRGQQAKPAVGPRAFTAPPSGAGDMKEKDKVEFKAEAPVVAQANSENLRVNQQQAMQANAPAPSPQAPNQAAQNQVNSFADQVQKSQQLENARALFYQQQLPINGRTAFAPLDAASERAGAGGGGSGKKKATQVAAGLAGFPMVHLGVRCSVVRAGDHEADLSTPLYAGEAVKLRLTPNADGFLYVYEGDALVASGQAKSMQKFETPELKSDAPGQRQFRVMLTRVPIAAGTLGAVGGVPRSNLVESASDRDAATYVVNGNGLLDPQQFVAPVTLTWR